MNKRKLVTNRGDYIMNKEDEYHVEATLSFTSTGHDDPQFPDTSWSMTFDATDAHIDVILAQFEHMLSAMGYVFSNKHLEMVSDDRDR